MIIRYKLEKLKGNYLQNFRSVICNMVLVMDIKKSDNLNSKV